MSRRHDLSDAELRDRIRHSMEHFRAERAANMLKAHAPRRRSFAVAATAIAAAAITIGIVSIVRPWLGPPGGTSDWVNGGAACRAIYAPWFVPDDWLEPGETRIDVRMHLEGLPLIGQERRGDGGLVVLGDERFVRICVVRDTAGSLGTLATVVVTEPRAAVGDRELQYRWGRSDGGGHLMGGKGPVVEAGVAGSEIDRVEVIREDGSRVTAILAEGIWVAWWPERLGGASIEAFDADGRLVERVSEGVTVSAPPSPVAMDVATDRCLDAIDSVPEEWRLPGEDFTRSLERVRALPLLIAHESTGHFLFGDETFWVLCTLESIEGEPPIPSVTSGPVEPPVRPVEFRAGGGSPDPFMPPNIVLTGTATDEVSRLEIELEGGGVVDADLVEGYWMASWAQNEAAEEIRAYDEGGELIFEDAFP
jgi:hypothetical protein